MRILMTTDTVGGVWTFTQELAGGLLQSGCAVALVSFGRSPLPAQQQWCDKTARAWNRSFFYKSSDTPLEWMQDNERAYTEAAPLLLDLAASFKPDILQSNQYCFGALPLDIPKILAAHSDVLSWAEYCRNGNLEDSAWLRCYRALVSEGLAQADTVASPTHWMLRAFASNFTLPKQTAVVPNGRSIAPGDPGTRKLQAVTAGRLWDEAKNISILREVQSPIPLFIAGEQPKTAEIWQIENATALGTLPCDELLALFRESSIYLCTSRYEPFGLAPLEAALCGCAVIANDIASLREVWQDAALYFSTASSLTALLRDLYNSPEKLRIARRKSFQRAKCFTAQRMVEGYLQLFHKALAHSEETAYAS